MALITCVECQNKVSDLAKDCPQCGAPVALSLKTLCFECGNLLEPGITVCNSCGVDQALNPEKEIVEPLKTKPSNTNQEKKPEQKPTEEKILVDPIKEKSQTKSEQIKESVKPPQSAPVASKPKSGCLMPLFVTLIVVVVLGFIVFNFLPDEMKRDIYSAFGLENSGFVKNDLATYINFDEVNSRKNMFGTWIVDGVLYNTHQSITVRQVDVKFKFSDFDETRTIYKDLRPGRSFASFFEQRFADHSGAYYEGCDVVEARE